jgi:hypothetical protein
LEGAVISGEATAIAVAPGVDETSTVDEEALSTR